MVTVSIFAFEPLICAVVRIAIDNPTKIFRLSSAYSISWCIANSYQKVRICCHIYRKQWENLRLHFPDFSKFLLCSFGADTWRNNDIVSRSSNSQYYHLGAVRTVRYLHPVNWRCDPLLVAGLQAIHYSQDLLGISPG